MWIAIAVAAVLVIAGGATAVVLLGNAETAEAAETVTLEPATSGGPDPFLASVTVTEAPQFPDTVLAVASASAASMPIDQTTGTLTSPGTADNLYGGRRGENAELYGGSGELAECDVAGLAKFLDANPSKAAAWAGVHDIAPAMIPQFLASLTPVVLLHDTAVTNYGFSNNVAVPRQAVLQAGTGVLVNRFGQPVVRCACGNPLSAPTVQNLAGAQVLGTRWDGYDPARTVVVSGGAGVTDLVVVDVATGESYTRPTGETAGVEAAGVGLLAAADGDIQQSADGQSWTSVAHTDTGSLRQLAIGADGRVVAAGGVAPQADKPGSGVLMTSEDGARWGDPVAVQDYLVDVAYGNGLWLAIGSGDDTMRDTSTDSVTFPLYRSTDGETWDRSEVTTAVDLGFAMNATSIVFGNGTWMVDVIGGLGDGGVQAAVISTDGATWTGASVSSPVQSGSAAYSYGRAWNGQLWGITGSAVFYDNGLDQAPRVELRVGGSTDGRAWQPLPAQPVSLSIPSLSCTGDRGWLAVGRTDELSGNVPGVIHTSPDLLTWTAIAGPAGDVTDVAGVGPAAAPAPASCGTPPVVAASAAPAPPTTPTAAAPTTPVAPEGECFVEKYGGTVDYEWVAIPVTPGGLTCSAMQARWTQYSTWPGETRGTVAAVDFPDGWTCGITPLAAQQNFGNYVWDGRWGECYPADGESGGFRIYSSGQGPGGSGDSAPVDEPDAGSSTGDLNLSIPMTIPPCDGTGIVLLDAAVTPGNYAAEIQQALNTYPNSQYLRTDRSCSSLNQATASGDPIYLVYRPIGPDQDAVCAAVRAAGGDAYGKWLDDISAQDGDITCG